MPTVGLLGAERSELARSEGSSLGGEPASGQSRGWRVSVIRECVAQNMGNKYLAVPGPPNTLIEIGTSLEG